MTGGAKYPECIWLGDAKFTRVFYSGVQKTGEARFPVTLGLETKSAHPNFSITTIQNMRGHDTPCWMVTVVNKP